MAVLTWSVTTIDGSDWLVFDVTKFRVPLDWDPSAGMFIAVCMPDGGLGSLPVLAKGDPGDTPTLALPVNLTALEATDPTVDSASWTATGTDTYQLNLTLHKGAQGTPGTSTLDATAYGTPLPKKILVVNSTSDGFVYQTQKIGDRYVPAVLHSAPAGNPTYTLGSVAIPAQDFDYRPTPVGQSVITPTAGDVVADLVARVVWTTGQTETSGPIVGRGVGVAALVPPLPPTVLSPGPPAGSIDSYDKVLAGNAATVYLRVERQAGLGTFTTDAATTHYGVRVSPVP